MTLLKRILKEKLKEGIIPREYPSKNMPDIMEAIFLIIKTIKEQKNIFISGDFDCDGICATSSMVLGLREILKKTKVEVFYRTPERKEGHGMNLRQIEEAEKNNCSLIITVDNGSNDLEMIKEAKKRGIETIVTDHHQISLEEKEIFFPLVNPLRGYNDSYLCGCGVVYKFLQELEKHPLLSHLGEETKNQIKMLTVLATITDMVPLRNENLHFILFFRKLFRFENGKPSFLGQLLNKLKFKPEDGKFYAWTLGPLFNSAGRLNYSNNLISLIINWDLYSLEEKQDNLEWVISLNERKKNIKEKYIDQVKVLEKEDRGKVESEKTIRRIGDIILIKVKNLDSGFKRLIGNEYSKDGKLVLVGGYGEIIKMSAINNTGVSLLDFFKKKPYILNVGGHLKAFGISYVLKEEESFIRDLNDFLNKNKKEIKTREIIDVNVNTLPMKEIEEISSFIWGQGLEEPLFRDSLEIGKITLLKKKHLKMDAGPVEIIKWGYTNDDNKFKIGETNTVKFTMGINEWMGKKKKQLFLI